MVIKRCRGGVGGGRSTSKSTCEVPAWTLTAFGDRSGSSMSKIEAGLNSDPEMIPFRSKSVTLSMLIDLLTRRCRSTQVKLYIGLIPSIDLWPQECGGSIVDWRTTVCSLLLHGSEGRSSKVFVADTSSATVGSSATIRTVSADETAVEVVMSVSGALRALVLFCKAVGVKPSPFVTEDFVGKASVTTAPWPQWLGNWPSAVTDQKSVTSSLHLPSRHRQSSMLGHDQRRPNKLWILWCRRWAPSTVTSQTDDDWCAVCGEDDGFACWEPNSCSCYTWQSPTNCQSTFAH